MATQDITAPKRRRFKLNDTVVEGTVIKSACCNTFFKTLDSSEEYLEQTRLSCPTCGATIRLAGARWVRKSLPKMTERESEKATQDITAVTTARPPRSSKFFDDVEVCLICNHDTAYCECPKEEEDDRES